MSNARKRGKDSGNRKTPSNAEGQSKLIVKTERGPMRSEGKLRPVNLLMLFRDRDPELRARN